MSRLQRAREKLRGRYRSRLPTSIAALRHALDGDPVDRHLILKLAHQLRGSGGTYGFDEITDAATAVQNAEEDDWVGAVEALIAACEQVCADAPESDELTQSR